MNWNADQHRRDLRLSGKTSLNLPALPDTAARTEDEFLVAVREVAAGEYDVLGEMGRGRKGSVVYLARDLSSARLVALKLEADPRTDEYTLEVVRQLDDSLPSVDSSCPTCTADLKGWGRYCPFCGTDLAGTDTSGPGELLEAVKEAAGAEFEVLGEMSRAEGGGRVYFARERSTGRIVALRLRKESTALGEEEFTLSRTQYLKPLAASMDATKLGQAVPPVPPRSAQPASPPQGGAPRVITSPPPASDDGNRRALIIGGSAAALFIIAAMFAISRGGSDDDGGAATLPETEVVPTAPEVAPTPVARAEPRTVDSAEIELRQGSFPSAARIRIEGVTYRPGATLKLPPGLHFLSITAAGYRAVSDSVRLRAGERLLYSPPTMERIPQVAREPRPQPRPAAPAEPPPEETADTPIVQIIPGQRQTPAPATPTPTADTCQALYDSGNMARARGRCEQEAGQGNAEAAYVLGVMYEQGQGVTPDLNRAVEEYQRAASGGSARAQLNLGLMYQDGRGVAKNDRMAADFFRRSAELGLADGQAQLGFAYQLGVGVAQDLGIAAQWYRRGAEQGHAWSQYLLGHLLGEGGRGVNADPAGAAGWLSRAAEQNVIAAQIELAAAYRDGRGVAQSDSAAIHWYERAGTPEAQAEAQRLRRRD